MTRSFLFFMAIWIAAPAAAQFDQLGGPQIGARENAITPHLVVNARAVQGGKAELAIVMDVKPGWHGYWLNPGDAGLPMSVDWQLPAGWSVGPLHYPVPHRLLVSGIVNYVYESDYVVLTTLTVPAGATGSQRIGAEMRWLACTDTVCVPEQGRVELNVPTGGMATSDSRFEGWRRALPRPLSSKVRFERDGDLLRIAIPLPASVGVTDPYFFPATDGALAYDAPQRIRRDGDTLIVEAKAGTDRPGVIDGVIAFGDGQGAEVQAVQGRVAGSGRLWLVGGSAAAALAGLALVLAWRRRSRPDRR